MLLGSALKLTNIYFFTGFLICLKHDYALVVFLIFCKFFNFAFNFAMQHHSPTAYCALNVDTDGYKIHSGHLVMNL